MNKHKVFKFLTIAIFVFIMLVTPVSAGCSCFGTGKIQLSTPELTLHESSNCFTWDRVKNAKNYEIFCNNERVMTMSGRRDAEAYVYDFTCDLTREGEYNFHVVATAGSRAYADSEPSEKVEYNCTEVPVLVAPEVNLNVNRVSDNYSGIIALVDGTNVIFNPSDIVADGFELYIYSTSTGLNVYPVLENKTDTGWYTVNISEYNLRNEIYAIRIGMVKGGEHLIASDLYYFNPNNYAPYTSKENIYMFDGLINDAYICNLPELRNLVYYNFIYRTPKQNIRISKDFEFLITKLYCKNTTSQNLNSAVRDAFNYFYETRDSHTISVTKNNNYEYTIHINYDSGSTNNNDFKPEPDITTTPTAYYYPDIDWDTYYELCGYTMRENDTKYVDTPYNFVSDNKYLYQEVESSEELYWAVENNITPICKTESTAEKIYNKAKEILNSIISDQMSDYEKALCIFDWICKNTCYDYYATVDKGGYNVAIDLVPAFYLEGVFITGYAVCDGFSKAYSLLCNMEGLSTMRIVGEALAGYDEKGNGIYGGHAWNKIKLDVSPDDNVGEQYYVVDITWTELVGSRLFNKGNITGNEVTSHEYFLVSDNEITSHFPFEERPKYFQMETGDRYNYYNETTFMFDADRYIPNCNTIIEEFDLVVNNKSDLEAILYYLLVNNRESIEVVIDYDYMLQVNKNNGGTIYDSYDDVVERFFDHIIQTKFGQQYLTVGSCAYQLITYNSYGDTGCIVVFQNHLLIDADNETGHLLDYMSHYDVYGEYELFITNAMLNKMGSGTELEQAQKLFESALNTFNIDMTLEFVRNVKKDNKLMTEFKVVFTEKTPQ